MKHFGFKSKAFMRTYSALVMRNVDKQYLYV